MSHTGIIDMGKIASKMLQHIGGTAVTTTTEAVQGETMDLDYFTSFVAKQDGQTTEEDDEEVVTHADRKKKLKVMLDGEKTEVILVQRRTKRKSEHKQKEEGQEEEEEEYPHKKSNSNSVATSPNVTNDIYCYLRPQSPAADEIEYGDVCITEEDIHNSEPVPELPIEILNGIFDYVKLEDRCMASMVCKSWLTAAWMRVTTMEFNLRHRPDQEAVITRILRKCANVRSVILRDCYGVSGRVLRHLPASVQSFEFFNCGNLVKTLTNDDLKFLPCGMLNLSLKNCENITDDAIPFFPASLRTLELSGSKISEFGVSRLPLGLRSLNLSRSQCPLRSLNFPETLVSLDLSFCLLESDAFICLPRSIRHINLSGCDTLTDQHLMNLAAVPALRSLVLDGADKITAKGIENLPSNLHSLTMKQCSGINDSAISSIPRNLKEFTFSKCKSVTKLAFVRLPASLTSLKLTHAPITDDIIGMLPAGITKLSLFGCKQVTDVGVCFIPQSVQELDLSWTSVSDKGLYGWTAPKLRKLNLSNTKVTREGMLVLQNTCVGLTVVRGARFCD